uniref:Uncharacterized protein n=1 Tax=Dulem virus 76 TaxID=3145787 RepID=A0AAU8B1F1_9VIRU
MSKIVDSINFKAILDDLALVRSQTVNGHLAICLNLKGTDSKVIVKEFNSDYQFKKFMIYSVIYGACSEENTKQRKTVISILNNFRRFLKEKEALNNDKIC